MVRSSSPGNVNAMYAAYARTWVVLGLWAVACALCMWWTLGSQVSSRDTIVVAGGEPITGPSPENTMRVITLLAVLLGGVVLVIVVALKDAKRAPQPSAAARAQMSAWQSFAEWIGNWRAFLAIGLIVATGIAMYALTSAKVGAFERDPNATGTVVSLRGHLWGWGSTLAQVSDVTAVSERLMLKADGSVVGGPEGLRNIVAIAEGGNHTLALTTDGTVVAWGSGSDGQTSVPAGLRDVTAIAAGYRASMALKSDGTVVEWGAGAMSTPEGLTDVVAIAAGYQYRVAVKRDGTITTWGWHSTEDWVDPPESLPGVVALSASWDSVLAVKSDGTVVAWGDNEDGQVTVPSDLSGVAAIVADSHYSLALKQDGTVVAWGDTGRLDTRVLVSLTDVTAISSDLAVVAGPRSP